MLVIKLELSIHVQMYFWRSPKVFSEDLGDQVFITTPRHSFECLSVVAFVVRAAA